MGTVVELSKRRTPQRQLVRASRYQEDVRIRKLSVTITEAACRLDAPLIQMSGYILNWVCMTHTTRTEHTSSAVFTSDVAFQLLMAKSAVGPGDFAVYNLTRIGDEYFSVVAENLRQP